MTDFKKTTLPIFYAKICVNLKENDSGISHDIKEVEDICSQYCGSTKLNVAITPTIFMNANEKEPGCFVEITNYCNVTIIKDEMIDKAVALAEIFLVKFHQCEITIICPDEIIMIQ